MNNDELIHNYHNYMEKYLEANLHTDAHYVPYTVNIIPLEVRQAFLWNYSLWSKAAMWNNGDSDEYKLTWTPEIIGVFKTCKI